MSPVILRGDARQLPLPDGSVDLIVTSPPYYGQRDYRDNGESLTGQIGNEATPQKYLASLLDCTREWARVLKPTGSIFVNLGDKYATRWSSRSEGTGLHRTRGRNSRGGRNMTGVPEKSLIGLPWRYALGCTDDIGLALRAEIIWSKPDATPESVRDRVRRTHEQVFHFTRQRHYYSAIDEIRVQPSGYSRRSGSMRKNAPGQKPRALADAVNPNGALPGSVWEIASRPLIVPAALEVDHHAAFPFDLARQCILGWSPTGICQACSAGRFPVVDAERTLNGRPVTGTWQTEANGHALGPQGVGHWRYATHRRLLGYACGCTPFTDHPERRGPDFHAATDRALQGMNDGNGGERYRRYVEDLANPRGPVREYHFDQWDPAPSRRTVVLDPFHGTGTTLLVADVLGRHAIGVDLSADYCRLARWRTTDPGERARAMGVPKPPPVPPDQDFLFDLGEVGA